VILFRWRPLFRVMPSTQLQISDAASTGVSILGTALAWLVSGYEAATAVLRRGSRASWQAAKSGSRRATTRTRRLFAGPVRRIVTGPVRVGLLGRRTDLSLLAVVLAPVGAVVAATWVGSTVGFETVEAWVRGTWYGTDPRLTVFVAVGVLVGLGTVYSGLNSGLVPTTLVTAGAVFGVAVTRYGTTVSRAGEQAVVSLPEAVGVASLVAVAVGVPLAGCGFVLGVALRRLTRVVRDQPGIPSDR